MNATPDLTFRFDGSIVHVEINTPVGDEWLAEHCDVPGWAHLGDRAIAIDHRLAGDVFDGAEQDISVEWAD